MPDEIQDANEFIVLTGAKVVTFTTNQKFEGACGLVLKKNDKYYRLFVKEGRLVYKEIEWSED